MTDYPDVLHRAAPGSAQNWQQRYESSLMGVFGTPADLLVSGRGCWVTDSQGRELLDMLGGIAVNALGHAHPALTAGLTEQLQRMGHISNLFTSVPQMRLAEMLLAAAQAPEGSSVFFANSGSEANEAALKAVLRHRRSTGKTRILALEGGFHGRTSGALSLTHKPAFREPFGDLIPGVEFLPVNDGEALERAFVADDVAGLFLEPIQGEAGVKPLQRDYLLAARELTRGSGALLVLDEVQTGIGRTGEWFRFQGVQRGVTGASGGSADGEAADLTPDLMTLAKGLGSGFPIGALVAFGAQHSALLGAGQHGSTFGGNPLAAVAGQITLETIEKEGLLPHVHQVGSRIAEGLRSMDAVSDVRQYGLHIGIDLDPEAFSSQTPAKAVVVQAREHHGLILNATGDHTLRLAPPLILTAEEADLFLNRFQNSCKDLAS
ncbi:acetylornithine transaminase [Nesterenkonia flava]|uniref:Acetylornithine transaminase n=1 Tax=Nesterenkonia flava TaxID=469799 RepID=A0ABU1FVI7_9MICC|nr:acetylornithine transaminase [Nesterenkonia flava]MDR5712690.1 acetylornithine transaminase [Nesterenkonia flava]